jgi:hypothetical protein
MLALLKPAVIYSLHLWRAIRFFDITRDAEICYGNINRLRPILKAYPSNIGGAEA